MVILADLFKRLPAQFFLCENNDCISHVGECSILGRAERSGFPDDGMTGYH